MLETDLAIGYKLTFSLDKEILKKERLFVKK